MTVNLFTIPVFEEVTEGQHTLSPAGLETMNA